MSAFHTKRDEGFTLIELLVVMAIIGILAALVLLNIPASLGRARDAQRKNDLKQIQTALQLYHNDYGHYPVTGSSWVTSKDGGFWLKDWTGAVALTANYIKTMPTDPKNSGCSGTADPVNDAGAPNCYEYAYYADGWCNLGTTNDGYILVTRLEQYQGTDLSVKHYYNSDGTECNTSPWPSAAGVSGIYTVSNP